MKGTYGMSNNTKKFTTHKISTHTHFPPSANAHRWMKHWDWIVDERRSRTKECKPFGSHADKTRKRTEFSLYRIHWYALQVCAKDYSNFIQELSFQIYFRTVVSRFFYVYMKFLQILKYFFRKKWASLWSRRGKTTKNLWQCSNAHAVHKKQKRDKMRIEMKLNKMNTQKREHCIFEWKYNGISTEF